MRYWDGSRWTQNVADGGVSGVDPEGMAPPPVAAAAPALPNHPQGRPGWVLPVVLGGAALVLLTVVSGAALMLSPASQTRRVAVASVSPTTLFSEYQGEVISDPTTTAAPTTAAPTTTAPPEPEQPAQTSPTPAPAPPARPVAPAPSAGGGCHPSYSGTCIPEDVFDADCAGGGGNGPWYVQEKDIKVVGPDVFELDRDGNGIGCESR